MTRKTRFTKTFGHVLAHHITVRRAALATICAPLLLVQGCVSIGAGGEPPTTLLTLSADAILADDTVRSLSDGAPLAVNLPSTPRLLDTLRVPVQVNDTSVAFVKQAFWADKPSRLFRPLLQESLALQTGRLVLPAEDIDGGATMTLSGTLSQFGYDADSAQAVAVYDALLRSADGTVSTRRFRATVPVSAVEPGLIGEALNEAANIIAANAGLWVKNQL